MGSSDTVFLNEEDRNKFYILLDSLTIYANDLLHVSDRLLSGDPEMISPIEQAHVCQEIWSDHKFLIDDFASDPDNRLMPDEIEMLRHWNKSLTGDFLAMERSDRTMFLIAHGYAFAVTGIAAEIGDIIPDTPIVVSSTLVPFGDAIVYVGYLVESPDVFDRPTQREALALLDDCVEKGHVVTTAADFERVVDELSQNEVQSELDAMMDEFGSDLSKTPNKGCTRGPLAGLESDERDELARKAEDAEVPQMFSLFAHLHDLITKGPVKTSLFDCLMTLTKDEIAMCGQRLFGNFPSSKRKDELASLFVEKLNESSWAFDAFMRVLSPTSIDLVERLINKGVVPVTFQRSLRGVEAKVPTPPFFFLFEDPKLGLVYSMPDEVRAYLKSYDFASHTKEARKRFHIVEMACDLVELYGVVTFDVLEEVLDDFYPGAYGVSGLSKKSVQEELESLFRSGQWNFELLDTGDEQFLIYSDLANDYYEAAVREGTSRNPRLYYNGPMSPVIYDIVSTREGAPRFPVTREMLSGRTMLTWEKSLPAVKGMRAYLDGNVPKLANPYQFGDDAVDSLISLAHGGYSREHFYQALERFGLKIDDAHKPDFDKRLHAFVSSVPNWFSYGWSEDRAVEKRTGHKIFYSSEGLPMKIGPNDPCPCGSGKRYCECHGKPAGLSTPGR